MSKLNKYQQDRHFYVFKRNVKDASGFEDGLLFYKDGLYYFVPSFTAPGSGYGTFYLGVSVHNLEILSDEEQLMYKVEFGDRLP